jgi:transmembrane sensor
MNIRLQLLLERYLSNNCTPSEEEELMQLVLDPENEHAVNNLIEKYIATLPEQPEAKEFKVSAARSQLIFDEILKQQRDVSPVLKMQPRQSSYKKWIWAAAAIFIAVIGVYSYLQTQSNSQHDKVVQTVIKDIAPPAGTNATILLANGQRIVLDSVNTGAIATQGNTLIKKEEEGQIVYNGKVGEEIQYNTLTIPRGGKVISITLSDGTRVWLNSESSLRYPVTFHNYERKVELTGEAYFEVTKDPGKKFIVAHNNVMTEVLGTHFNVNTYADEKDIKVTLLEGAVKVKKGTNSHILKPGQQASVAEGITINDNVNLDQVVAWKEGKFSFGEATPIRVVMNQLARWYDIEVEFEGNVEGRPGGTISRNLPVSKVLKMLKMTGVFEFRIVGKKVIVEQNKAGQLD